MKISRILDVIMVALFAGMLSANIAQVIFRYFLNSSLFWSEELSIMMMIVMVFMASPVLIRDSEHITIDIFNSKSASIKIMDIIQYIITTIILLIFSYLIYKYMLSAISRDTKTAALRAPMWIPIGAMLAGMLLSALFAVRNLYRTLVDLKDRRQGNG